MPEDDKVLETIKEEYEAQLARQKEEYEAQLARQKEEYEAATSALEEKHIKQIKLLFEGRTASANPINEPLPVKDEYQTMIDNLSKKFIGE